MSEPENMNFDPDLPNRPVNVERILSELEPQPLAISRDELFFQAGFAAGSRRHTVRLFWPSAVAALLLISCGLGAALVWQNNSPRSSVAVLTLPSPMLGENSELAAKPQTDMERDVNNRFLVDFRQRGWQRLASAAPLPSGRLTATGWQELPPEMRRVERRVENGTGESDSSPSTDREFSPQHPATYLELMRQQGEG